MIENLQEMPEVQKIIALGKANREVSYDEINEILPDKILNSEKIDDVFTLLHELGIEVVEDYTKEAVEEAIQAKPEKVQIIFNFEWTRNTTPSCAAQDLKNASWLGFFQTPERKSFTLTETAITEETAQA